MVAELVWIDEKRYVVGLWNHGDTPPADIGESNWCSGDVFGGWDVDREDGAVGVREWSVGIQADCGVPKRLVALDDGAWRC